MVNIAIFIILYLIIPYGFFVLIKFAKERIKYAMFGRRRSASAIKTANAKEGLNQKITKRLKFTIKDPRYKPIPFKLLFFIIYFTGLALAGYAGFLSNWKLFLGSIGIAYIAMIFSIITANKIVKERQLVLKRMMELKSSKMKLVDRDKTSTPTIEGEFKILKWGEDLINPIQMEVYMPTDFDLLTVDSFMESFNLIFGANGQWVSDDSAGGFDFNAGIATIKVSPKLPQMAMWNERYLDPKFIHWTYFPLALGSENGVPLVNEETGETERVIGFAVSDGQAGLSKKNGAIIGPEITAAPQILVAGGTGGGKALSSQTNIRAVIDEKLV